MKEEGRGTDLYSRCEMKEDVEHRRYWYTVYREDDKAIIDRSFGNCLRGVPRIDDGHCVVEVFSEKGILPVNYGDYVIFDERRRHILTVVGPEEFDKFYMHVTPLF